MKTRYFIFITTLLLLTFNVQSKEMTINPIIDDSEELFTTKDKGFLQLGHYDEVEKMNLAEEENDAYFSLLYQYTYKMSSLGSSKYSYTNSERKHEFEKLANKLEKDMKSILTPSNYSIHQNWFEQIEELIYERRCWNL